MKKIKSYKGLQNAGLEKMALAAEADAGQALPGLRESLAEARAGVFAEVHTPAPEFPHVGRYSAFSGVTAP